MLMHGRLEAGRLVLRMHGAVRPPNHETNMHSSTVAVCLALLAASAAAAAVAAAFATGA
jgi:hypothetical protein